MSDTPDPKDPQTGEGAAWGAEFVDSPHNEPGDQDEPEDQTGTSSDSR